jgi:DTW domain-containing protein YfiP
MAHLAIENSVLICDRQFTSNDRVNSLIADPSLQCVVLFPGPHSVNLSLIPPSQVQAQFDADRKLLIFVIDGTWAEAKRMVRQSANLCGLPQICFTPQRPSEYKIRQQPHEYCVSSIEAVHQLLGILDPSTDADHLLELFRSMVALQIQCFQKNRMPELLQVPEYAGTI